MFKTCPSCRYLSPESSTTCKHCGALLEHGDTRDRAAAPAEAAPATPWTAPAAPPTPPSSPWDAAPPPTPPSSPWDAPASFIPAAGPPSRSSAARRIAFVAGAAVVAVAAVVGGVLAARSGSRSATSVRADVQQGATTTGAGRAPTSPATGLPAVVELPGPASLRLTNASGPVLTPDQARQITTTIYRLRAAALAAHDATTFQQIDTGVALESDIPACGCLGEAYALDGITDMAVFVPRQTSFPARFMAEVATSIDGKPAIENMVIVRARADDSWRLAVENGVGFQPGLLTLDPPLVDAGGYDLLPTPPGAAPAGLFAQLAAYWQHWKDTGKEPDPSPFAPGAFTTKKGVELASHPQDQVQADGLYGHYTYRYDPADPIYSFGIAGGWTVSCSAVRHTTLDTPPPGHVAIQDLARNNWGPTLAPGRYPALEEQHIEQSCIFSRSDRSEPPAVAGDTNATTMVSPVLDRGTTT